LKIMAKMGVSTLLSYSGAQLFEALGIGKKVMEDCFSRASSPIGGIGYAEIAVEALRRHANAFTPPAAEGAPETAAPALHNEGYLRVNKRGEGEFHGWNPKVIAAMNRF